MSNNSNPSLEELIAIDKNTLDTIAEKAELNHRTAQLSLAIFYMGAFPRGDYETLGFQLHIPQKANPVQSAKWWRRAADLGDAQSQYQMGDFFNTGYGVPQDKALAFKYYHMSGVQGDAKAQQLVGKMLISGDGVSENRSLGVQWLQKAAGQDDVCSLHYLGLIYEYAHEENPSRVELCGYSRTWFKRAAELGHKESCFHLGEIFRKGAGVAINVHQARKYLRRAATQGHADAIESLKDVCLCTSCGSRGAMRLCECCWRARYCGPECQRNHWNGIGATGGVRDGGAEAEKHKHTCPQTHGRSRGGKDKGDGRV